MSAIAPFIWRFGLVLAIVLVASIAVEGQTHPVNFWTLETKVESATLVAASALDGYSTQVAINSKRFHELNPLASPFVAHGAAGQVAACAIGVGAVLGAAYLAHRTHHEKLRRFILRASVGAESANSVYQFSGR